MTLCALQIIVLYCIVLYKASNTHAHTTLTAIFQVNLDQPVLPSFSAFTDPYRERLHSTGQNASYLSDRIPPALWVSSHSSSLSLHHTLHDRVCIIFMFNTSNPTEPNVICPIKHPSVTVTLNILTFISMCNQLYSKCHLMHITFTTTTTFDFVQPANFSAVILGQAGSPKMNWELLKQDFYRL